MAVNAITIGEAFYLLNNRYLLASSLSIKAHLENRYLPIGIGAVALLHRLARLSRKRWPDDAAPGPRRIPLTSS